MVYFKREKQKQHLSDIYQNTIDLIGENKHPLKTDQFFRGDQYFSPTNNFTRIKLTPTKNFYQLFFLLNKSQIMEILKNIRPDLQICWFAVIQPGLQETCGSKKFFF